MKITNSILRDAIYYRKAYEILEKKSKYDEEKDQRVVSVYTAAMEMKKLLEEIESLKEKTTHQRYHIKKLEHQKEQILGQKKKFLNLNFRRDYMKAHVRTEGQMNFMLFSDIYRMIMKNVDGKYVASVRLRIGGTEEYKDFIINVVQGEVDFEQLLQIGSLEKYEIISVERVKEI